MLKIFLLLLLIISCKTSDKNTSVLKDTNIQTEDLGSEANQNKTPPEEFKTGQIYKILSDASSIKVFAYAIESGDFATELYKAKLRDKEVKIVLSRYSTNNLRSRKKYLQEVELELLFADLRSSFIKESFIIIDDKFVVRDYAIFIENINSQVTLIPIKDELDIFNECYTNPKFCKKTKNTSGGTPDNTDEVSTKLPSKTKKQLSEE